MSGRDANQPAPLTDEELGKLIDVATYEVVARDRAETAAMTNCESAVWRRIAQKLASVREARNV